MLVCQMVITSTVCSAFRSKFCCVLDKYVFYWFLVSHATYLVAVVH